MDLNEYPEIVAAREADFQEIMEDRAGKLTLKFLTLHGAAGDDAMTLFRDMHSTMWLGGFDAGLQFAKKRFG